jgi:hypothetical protein
MHKKPYLIETDAEFAFHWNAMLLSKRILKVPKEFALTVANDKAPATCDHYFIAQVHCSVCGENHISAWPVNMEASDDEQECVSCENFTCAPKSEIYQEIYWS